jgi:putative transcriptional regulator
MTDSDMSSLKGQFLVAMPGLADPNFSSTVSIICEHNEQGAVGIIINRVHEQLSGEDIFKELEMDYTGGVRQMPIHIGGPVHIGEIFLIHGPPFSWESSLMVTPHLAMSNTRDVIESIALGKGPQSFILSLGCAGWGPGQLESEIRENAWLTHPVMEEIVFEVPVADRWHVVLRQMGIDPTWLSNTAGTA